MIGITIWLMAGAMVAVGVGIGLGGRIERLRKVKACPPQVAPLSEAPAPVLSDPVRFVGDFIIEHVPGCTYGPYAISRLDQVGLDSGSTFYCQSLEDADAVVAKCMEAK